MTDENVLIQTKRIDLPKFDPTEYIGLKSVIKGITEKKGQFGYYVLFTSAVLGKVGSNDLTASKMVGLQVDEAGQIGWGADTKMDLLLKEFNVNHYLELLDKPIVIQTRTDKEGNKYLTF